MSAGPTTAATTAALLAVLCALGCGAASKDAQLPRYQPTDRTQAQAAKSADRPMIIEWPAPDRAALEAQRSRGLVVVRYAAGQMEVLRGCSIQAAYRYSAITPKEEAVSIRDRDELAAAMPIHSARVEARLEARQSLEVRMTIVGVYEADKESFRRADLVGQCEGATHAIRALSVGAFELLASASSTQAAGATVMGLGAGAESQSDHEVLNRDGDKKSCARSAERDAGPPFGCGALLRVEVAPVLYPATDRSCPAGLVRRGDDCVSVAGDRPGLLEVLQPK